MWRARLLYFEVSICSVVSAWTERNLKYYQDCKYVEIMISYDGRGKAEVESHEK